MSKIRRDIHEAECPKRNLTSVKRKRSKDMEGGTSKQEQQGLIGDDLEYEEEEPSNFVLESHFDQEIESYFLRNNNGPITVEQFFKNL